MWLSTPWLATDSVSAIDVLDSVFKVSLDMEECDREVTHCSIRSWSWSSPSRGVSNCKIESSVFHLLQVISDSCGVPCILTNPCWFSLEQYVYIAHFLRSILNLVHDYCVQLAHIEAVLRQTHYFLYIFTTEQMPECTEEATQNALFMPEVM